MTTELPMLTTRPESISELVYTTIRDAIVDKTLAPGSTVSEASLARSLNVSKTPVREALLRLRQMRLVEPEAGGRRLRVIIPSRKSIMDAYETREALDPAVAALAAKRATETQKMQLHKTAAQSVGYAEISDGEGFRGCDREFHATIAKAAANPHLTAMAQNALILTETLRARDAPSAGDSIQCADDHTRIAEAITQGDGVLAARLAVGHVQHVRQNVLNALSVPPLEGVSA